MGEYVWVESFEALKRLRAALCRFAETVGAGLGEADASLQRERDWVKLARPNYWAAEAKKRSEQLAKAKIALAGKKFETTPLGGRPSFVEEEKALARAMRRVEEAEQKLANLHYWRRRFDEEFFTYQAVASGMSQALAADIPKALARLDNMLTALEAYAVSAAPGMQGSTAAGKATLDLDGDAGSMARPTAPTLHDLSEYQRLRTRTPSAEARNAVPISGMNEDPRPADEPRPTWPEQLERLGYERMPVAAEGKVVLARGVAHNQRIYLERQATAAAGDSGWFVGRVDEVAAPEYDAACVADVLAVRPDFAPLFELPPGYLAILDGIELEAVLDADDNRLWPAAQGDQP
jgi:hypothetical protein